MTDRRPRTAPADLLLGVTLAVSGPLLRLGLVGWANHRASTVDHRTLAQVAAAAAVVGGLTVAVVVLVARRDAIVTGALVGCAGFFFFAASVFGGSFLGRTALWLVVSVLSGLGLAGALGRRLVAVSLVVPLIVAGIGLTVRTATTERRAAASSARTDGHRAGGDPDADRPNAYLLIVDALGRSDVLATLGYDDAELREGLASAGLVTDASATSAYPATNLSVPAVLEQRYVVDADSDRDALEAWRGQIMGGDNVTVDQLRALGYEYVHAEAGLSDDLDCIAELVDHCITPPDGGGVVDLGETSRALLELTPLGPLGRAQSISRDAAATPLSVLAGLQALRSEITEPFFLKAHLMIPHPPYRVAADCTPRARTLGSLAKGWDEVHVAPYLDQVRCLQTQLVDAVTAIVRHDPDAIVVVMSDHGPAFHAPVGAPVARWTLAQVTERFGIHRSMRLPEGCRSDDEDASSSVNTMILVVACISGTDPRLLPAAAYLVPPWGADVEPLPDPILDPA